MTKDIYELKLHELIEIKPGFTVLRVPNGWIYLIGEDVTCLTTTFVPFNNEFEDKFKGAI